MQSLRQDLRYGARMLMRRRGFAVIAVITLGLGIGANTTMFSVINGLLLRPMPYKDPERLVHLDERAVKAGFESLGISFPDFSDWRARGRSFEQMALYDQDSFTLASGASAGRAERVEGARVTASLFPLLGVEAAQGRHFLEEEDKPGAAPAVIIGYGLWQRRFGGDPGVIGRSARIDGENATIVGVMPSGFGFPVNAEIWKPRAEKFDEKGRGSHSGYGIGRLKPGVKIETARSEIEAVAAAIESEHPQTNKGVEGIVEPWRYALLEDSDEMLWLLLGAVGFILLIACANVANLLLTAGASRAGEMAIRSALGASRASLMRQSLIESLLLASAGGALGLPIALWGAVGMMAMIPEALPAWMKFSIDWRVIAFTLSATTATALLCGIVPSWQASKTNLMSVMKDGARGAVGSRKQRLRNLLVVGEVALAMTLLVSAGLMMKDFIRVRQVNAGFNAGHVMTAKITLPETQYSTPAGQINFFRQLLQRIRATPGVESAALTSSLPLSDVDISGSGFYIEGKPEPKDLSQIPIALHCVVSPDYFKAMGMRLLRGRDFNDADVEGKEKVVIVDETVARRVFADEDPIGRRVRFGGASSGKPWLTIVGVVNAIRNFGLKKDAGMQAYQPYQQESSGNMTIVARATGDPAGLTSAMRNEVAALDKDLPLYAPRPMAEVVAIAMWDDKYVGILFGLFAALALSLAAVGIYGAVSYSVAQRTREIGLRMALGAQTGDVMRMIIRQGIALAGLGVAIGLGGGALAAQLMKSQFFNVSPTDPWTFTLLPLALLAVALVACWIPARRAMKVDPMIALRCE
ncbi:MAG: ABC transporter permease [Chloracidobacterium sp.]|nr:ABC transporter permease [Chloracidobacterium sp.]